MKKIHGENLKACVCLLEVKGEIVPGEPAVQTDLETIHNVCVEMFSHCSHHRPCLLSVKQRTEVFCVE